MSEANRINSHLIGVQLIVLGIFLVAIQIVGIVGEQVVGVNGAYYPDPVIPFFKVLSTLAYYLPGIAGILGVVTGFRNLHKDIRLLAKIVFCVVAFFAEAFFIGSVTGIITGIRDALPMSQVAADILGVVMRLLYLLIPFLCAAAGSLGGSIAASLGRTYIRIASIGTLLYNQAFVGLTLCYAVEEFAFTACAAVVFCIVHRNEGTLKIILLKLIAGLLNGFLLELLASLTICPLILKNMAPKYADYMEIHLVNIYDYLIAIGIPVIAITIDAILIIQRVKRRKLSEAEDYPVWGESDNQPGVRMDSFHYPDTVRIPEARDSSSSLINETTEPPVLEAFLQQEQRSDGLPAKEDTNDHPPLRFCYKCGFELYPGSAFCSKCGTRIQK